MLKIIQVVVVYLVVNSAVWAGPLTLEDVLKKPSLLSKTTSSEKMQLINELMDLKYSQNKEVLNLVSASLIEYFEDRSNNGAIAEFGYLIHTRVFLDRTETELTGTVFMEALDELGERIFDIKNPEEEKLANLGYYFFLATLEIHNLFNPGTTESIKTLEQKQQVMRIFNTYRSQRDKRILESERIKKAVQSYVYGSDYKEQISNADLAKTFIDKILSELNSNNETTKKLAIDVLVNKDAASFLDQFEFSFPVINALETLKSDVDMGYDFLIPREIEKIQFEARLLKRFIK